MDLHRISSIIILSAGRSGSCRGERIYHQSTRNTGAFAGGPGQKARVTVAGSSSVTPVMEKLKEAYTEAESERKDRGSDRVILPLV